MSHSIDPIARAYAVIGLRPGASAGELKRRYRSLAKTWHPDRWANDPVNAAESAQRMRVINDAYATLHRAQAVGALGHVPRTADGVSKHNDEPPPHAADHWSTSHRAMTDEELDAVVRAIGSDSVVTSGLRFLWWFAPIVTAVLLTLPTGRGETARPPTAVELLLAVALFVGGIAAWFFQRSPRR